jgi:hypothetical protein
MVRGGPEQIKLRFGSKTNYPGQRLRTRINMAKVVIRTTREFPKPSYVGKA